MRLVVFGRTVGASGGNGRATLWRGLMHALARAGHSVDFFERGVPALAARRELHAVPNGELVRYPRWADVVPRARRALAHADVAIVTSGCPDGPDATALVLDAPVPVRAFHDLDTARTLAPRDAGEPGSSLPPEGLADFDLVLSCTGGAALDALRTRLGARRVRPLYASVDPDVFRPAAPRDAWRCDLSYVGRHVAERQPALDRLFLAPARRMPARRFALAGAGYPADVPWPDNVRHLAHLSLAEHAAWYASSRLTLQVTRGPAAALGWCPSPRLFEAAACGVPILSDWWTGLDAFYTPGDEIVVARDTTDALAALSLPDETLRGIARRARERTLDEHTTARRARELLDAIAWADTRVAAERAVPIASSAEPAPGAADGGRGPDANGGDSAEPPPIASRDVGPQRV